MDFFSPADLTDDQILAKIQRLQHNISYCVGVGNSPSTIHSMEIFLAMLEEEYEARMEKKVKENEELFAKQMSRSKNKHPDDELNRSTKSNSIIIGRIEGVDD